MPWFQDPQGLGLFSLFSSDWELLGTLPPGYPALSCGLHCGFSPPVSFLGVSIHFLKCLTSKVSFYDVVMSRICRRARHRLCPSDTVAQVESLWKQYKSFHPMHRLRCDGRQCTEIHIQYSELQSNNTTLWRRRGSNPQPDHPR